MPISPKDWKDDPDVTTPLSAAALEDLETRMGAYADTQDALLVAEALVDAKGDLIAATAADSPARVAVGTDGQVLTADSSAGTGMAWAAAAATGVSVLDRATTLIDVVNSTAETTVYTYSVGADVLSTNKGVRLTLIGDYFNNSGANKTLTVRVKFGATTLFEDTTAAITPSAIANRRQVEMVCGLFNQGATNDQSLSGRIAVSHQTAPVTGRGCLDNALALDCVLGGDSAVDSTSAQAFVVTVTHETAAATISFRRQLAVLELV